MNTGTQTGRLAEAKAALEGIGLAVAPARAPKGASRVVADAWLRIGRGKDAACYLVEVKSAVAPGMVGALTTQLRDRAAQAGWPTLLVTHYLTPPVADALRARGQQFADGVGNAFLTAPGLYVYVAGRRPKAKLANPRAAGAPTTNGVKLLFALLCDPNLVDAPHRTLATAGNVALGAVPALLDRLQAAGHVFVREKRRRFRGTKRLLDEWAQDYARRLRPKTLLGSYTTERFDQWREWALAPGVRWGAEPAGALLTKYLRPGILTLYAERLPGRFVAEQRLVKEDRPREQRYLELRRPFWGAALDEHAAPATVPPVLVYADLLAVGEGRCIETAQMLYETHLARLLPTA